MIRLNKFLWNKNFYESSQLCVVLLSTENTRARYQCNSPMFNVATVVRRSNRRNNDRNGCSYWDRSKLLFQNLTIQWVHKQRTNNWCCCYCAGHSIDHILLNARMWMKVCCKRCHANRQSSDIITSQIITSHSQDNHSNARMWSNHQLEQYHFKEVVSCWNFLVLCFKQE